uniref:Hydrogenase/urease nickel incorporation protein n=1 Tax=Ackermannviridae sp. TaxID=2831612 RepID=A0A8S5RQP2_9CAUD|nr:MAG TPA: hydrogenase/urease nickel incorporation protein [Ackermannviridae sp.]
MRLIDEDELKKRAIKVCFADVPDCGEFDAVGVSDIDIMPTIDPESLRPTAEWENSFYQSRKEGKFIVCTRCRHSFSKKGLWCRKYCPECGARMVNADESI